MASPTLTIAKRDPSFITDVIAGSMGGFAGKMIEFPFDTLKVRLQTAYSCEYNNCALHYLLVLARGLVISDPHPHHPSFLFPLTSSASASGSSTTTSASSRLSPRALLKSIISSDGPLSLYRGMSLPLAGTILETATLFSANGYLKRLLRGAGHIAPDADLPLKYVFAAGGGTGFCVSWVLTPIELVKCRLQVSGQPVAGGPPNARHLSYTGPIDCIAQSVKKEGLGVLYRGHAATLLREIPGTACWFAAYETFLRGITPKGAMRDSLHPAYIISAGACGGMSYWAIMYPADTIKSAMQTASQNARLSFSATAHAIYKAGGTRALYAGATPTLLRAAPSNAALFYVYESSLMYLERQWPEL